MPLAVSTVLRLGYDSNETTGMRWRTGAVGEPTAPRGPTRLARVCPLRIGLVRGLIKLASPYARKTRRRTCKREEASRARDERVSLPCATPSSIEGTGIAGLAIGLDVAPLRRRSICARRRLALPPRSFTVPAPRAMAKPTNQPCLIASIRTRGKKQPRLRIPPWISPTDPVPTFACLRDIADPPGEQIRPAINKRLRSIKSGRIRQRRDAWTR